MFMYFLCVAISLSYNVTLAKTPTVVKVGSVIEDFAVSVWIIIHRFTHWINSGGKIYHTRIQY